MPTCHVSEDLRSVEVLRTFPEIRSDAQKETKSRRAFSGALWSSSFYCGNGLFGSLFLSMLGLFEPFLYRTGLGHIQKPTFSCSNTHQIVTICSYSKLLWKDLSERKRFNATILPTDNPGRPANGSGAFIVSKSF